jgi:hypothetical protein
MLPGMDRKRLERQREAAQRELQEAERELDAAKGRTAVNAAARKHQRARAELGLPVEKALPPPGRPRVRVRAGSAPV